MHEGQCHWENMVVPSPYHFFLPKKKVSLPFKGISVVLWHTSCEDNEHHTLKIYNNK